MGAAGVTAAGTSETEVLLARLRPNEKDAADARELMELRRCNLLLTVELSRTGPRSGSGRAASGSGITISIKRSCRGILVRAMLPASLETRECGLEALGGTMISSSKGRGALSEKADRGNERRCRTISVCERDKCRRRLCHCAG